MSYPQTFQREGGCLCGAVRFRLQGQPHRVGLCPCLDCRKVSGSYFSAFAIWPRNSFEATGEFGTYDGRSFCRTCGGRVFALSDDGAEITLGSLDDAPGDIAPEYELWIGRREEWMEPLPWAEQFPHDRLPANEAPTADEEPPSVAQQTDRGAWAAKQ